MTIEQELKSLVEHAIKEHARGVENVCEADVVPVTCEDAFADLLRAYCASEKLLEAANISHRYPNPVKFDALCAEALSIIRGEPS